MIPDFPMYLRLELGSLWHEIQCLSVRQIDNLTTQGNNKVYFYLQNAVKIKYMNNIND